MRCEVAVVIDSCPDYVWAVLTDVARWPSWTSAVRRTTLVGGAPFGPGGAVRVVASRLPERTWHITECSTRRSFTWAHDGVGYSAAVQFRLTGQDGVTRLVIVHDRSGWIGSAVARLTSRTVSRHLHTLAGDLKVRCEQRRPVART